MRNFTYIAVYLLSKSVFAGTLDLMPSLDSIHVVQSVFPSQPEAANKAQKAFVIQSGLESNYNSFREKTNSNLSYYGDKAKTTTEDFVDDHTYLNSKVVGFTLAAAYTVTKTKKYTQNFGDPFITGLHHSITIAQDKIMTSINYSF